MKTLLAASICCLAMTSASFAASVTVSDKSSTLALVAAATAALLLDAGIKTQNVRGVVTVEAKNFHCDQHSNAAAVASSVRAGLPTLKCRINSQNKRGAAGGTPFGEGRAMTGLLEKVQEAGGGVAFTDCAMGYCGTFAKSIKCTIDTKIDNLGSGGRWTCVYTDGQ